MATETGLFWLPDNPDETVRGQLSIDDAGRVRVALLGSLTPALEVVDQNAETGETMLEPADDPPNLHIHGLVAGSPREVTLFDCLTPHREGPFGDQVLSAGRLFRGAHLLGAERYTGVRIRVKDIDAWAGLPDPSVERIKGVGIEVKAHFSDIPSAPLSQGGELSIDDVLFSRWTLHAGAVVRREVWIAANDFAELTYKEIDANFVTPIAGYLSMALGETATIVGVQVKSGDQWLSVTHSGMRPGDVSSDQHREPLLPLWATGLDVLGSFLDAYSKAGPAVPVIRDLLSNARSFTIDTQILELTTLAEGLHERLFPEDERMSKADAKRVRELVRAALAEEENPRYADIVNGAVLNYLGKPNYKSRLRRLADEAETAMPGVCGDRDKWVERVDAARNNFAHRKDGFISAEAIDEMYSISESLRWVLMGNILLAAKVPTDVLMKRIKQDSRYFFFLRNVRLAAPDIFPKEEQEESDATSEEEM